MLSKFNKIIFSKEQAKPVENLGGKIFVNKDLIFNNKVSIMPGTIFEIMPGKNIIFKNKVLSLGTKDLPIIFERYEKNNKKNWGTVALLGKNTDGSIFKHTNFIGGSGGTHNQFKFTSMFSIHDTKNIKVINSNFRENEAYDDTIHIVYSKNILFEDVKVDKVYSDAIDVDISSNITFKNIEIKNSKNDGLDFMELMQLLKIQKFIGQKIRVYQ